MPEGGGILENNMGVAFTQGHQIAPYRTYNVECRYVWNEGLIQVPIAGPKTTDDQRTPCEIVREHAPCGYKEVRFEATRIAAQPAVPHPLSYRNNPNEVFYYADVVVTVPALGIVGETTWGIRGVYRYHLLKPIWVEDGLRSGASPLDTAQEVSNIYDSTDFNPNLQ